MKKRILISSSLLIIASVSIINKAKAFIPTIYEPSIKDFKSQGINLGKTAAQLLYFNQIEKANEIAKLAVKLNPSDDRLWAILAETQIQGNKNILARESLKKAQKINPTEASYYFKEAFIDFELRQIKNSIILITKGLKIDPNNAEGHFQLGNSRIMQKKYNKALLAFKAANKIKPKFWQSLNNQGLVLYEMNKKEKAILIWKKTLTIEENAEPMLAVAAAEYEQNKENRNCIELAKQALLKNPQYVSEKYQKDQLWGENLRKSTKHLFKNPLLIEAVTQAIANSK